MSKKSEKSVKKDKKRETKKNVKKISRESQKEVPLEKAEKVETEKKPRKKERYFYAVGRRKTAVATVILKPGKGEIVINQRPVEQYFPREEVRKKIFDPLVLLNQLNQFDISVKTSGGGFNAQAEAIRLGISRALVKFNEEFRSMLKKSGFLTRDAREKERKKPGLKRARRAPQWQKR